MSTDSKKPLDYEVKPIISGEQIHSTRHNASVGKTRSMPHPQLYQNWAYAHKQSEIPSGKKCPGASNIRNIGRKILVTFWQDFFVADPRSYISNNGEGAAWKELYRSNVHPKLRFKSSSGLVFSTTLKDAFLEDFIDYRKKIVVGLRFRTIDELCAVSDNGITIEQRWQRFHDAWMSRLTPAKNEAKESEGANVVSSHSGSVVSSDSGTLDQLDLASSTFVKPPKNRVGSAQKRKRGSGISSPLLVDAFERISDSYKRFEHNPSQTAKLIENASNRSSPSTFHTDFCLHKPSAFTPTNLHRSVGPASDGLKSSKRPLEPLNVDYVLVREETSYYVLFPDIPAKLAGISDLSMGISTHTQQTELKMKISVDRSPAGLVIIGFKPAPAIYFFRWTLLNDCDLTLLHKNIEEYATASDFEKQNSFFIGESSLGCLAICIPCSNYNPHLPAVAEATRHVRMIHTNAHVTPVDTSNKEDGI